MTRILSYSPSIEAYAAASGEGGDVSYYNLSPDIERVTAMLKENGASTCTIRLQNKNGKYNGLFLPMDRVTVYATKRDEKHQLFTGYITSVPSYRMYPDSFELNCACPLYRLQRLYWDPGLLASAEVMGYGDPYGTWDRVLVNMLVKVAGIPAENIRIGDMPEEVMSWARELYAAKMSDAGDMRSRTDEFYSMLASTNVMTADTYGAASGLNEPLKAGETLVIPSSVQQTGIIGDYTGYNKFWSVFMGAAGTGQKAVAELWAANGSRYRRNIAVIGKYFLVAMRPMFGNSGDYLDIKLEDGAVIQAIMADAKGSDALEWGHDYGGRISLVEFEVLQGAFANSDLGDWYGKKVVSVTNRGPCR